MGVNVVYTNKNDCPMTFKERYNEHKSSFNNERYKNSTTLSTYIWDMKSKDVIPTLKWSIVSQTKAYNNISKTCQLCLNEKLEILSYKNKRELLNKRSEIIAKFNFLFPHRISFHQFYDTYSLVN